MCRRPGLRNDPGAGRGERAGVLEEARRESSRRGAGEMLRAGGAGCASHREGSRLQLLLVFKLGDIVTGAQLAVWLYKIWL